MPPIINVIARDGESWWAKDSVAVAADPAAPASLQVVSDSDPTAAQSSQGLIAGFAGLPGVTYTAAVSFGDGSAPVFATVSPHAALAGGGESYWVTAPPHTYAKAGGDTAVFNVIAPGGASAWTSAPVTVLPATSGASDFMPAAVSGTPGTALESVLLTTFDSPGQSYTLAIDWGDGSTPTFGAVLPVIDPLPPGSGGGSSTPIQREAFGSHTYLGPGTYTIVLNLIGADGESDWTSTRATITGPPPSA